MHLTLFIKSVLLLMLLNGATVSSAQAASLVYKSSCMSNSGEDLGPQLGMLVEERAGGALFIFRNSIDVPSSLPGGNAIGFHTDFSGDSDTQSIATKGVLNNRVNALGEWVSFLGPCANASSFNSLIAALANGQFRVGRHVQGIGLAGTANSYINQRSAVPLPAAAWLFSSALFGFIVFANRRKV
ncbi:hypothetical protein HK44_003335 [Pseudomonas fluorescens HK44]|uniref:Uncharacterized protein n=1 Tax=Pseudomonas fluorescens HK44 TaxID=1042209 RepID=A0A010SI65_PSEFL|nr:hypothetical protein [Pseudomonas fluorescens]EXF92760.1 hypothetical protein HK44_003335 [Pseudomonas fluorescens HK44]